MYVPLVLLTFSYPFRIAAEQTASLTEATAVPRWEGIGRRSEPGLRPVDETVVAIQYIARPESHRLMCDESGDAADEEVSFLTINNSVFRADR
jgi:hypothetical protein